jgi:hypothetical protein
MGKNSRAFTPIRLKETESVSNIRKEHHVRRQNGQHVAYILHDKLLKRHLILSQKLSFIVDYISAHAEDTVSASSLFKIIPCGGGTQVGRRTKCRWAIEQCDLESAGARLEAARKDGPFQQCMVLGTPACYQIS